MHKKQLSDLIYNVHVLSNLQYNMPHIRDVINKFAINSTEVVTTL